MEVPAYWVWHRSSELTEKEISELHHAGTKTLYWQAVECGWKDGKWDAVRISKALPQPDDITVLPVFRIKPETAFLETPDAAKALARLFTLWADGTNHPELQIDFDCPVRLLNSYGKFLRELGVALSPTKISITALASWPQHPDFPKLARSVESMAPMFYDLYTDTPGQVRQNRFQPLADEKTRALIEAWSACPVPWRAGLANFERASLYTAEGNLSGHLRSWSHDRLFFHDRLKGLPLGKGVTVYQAAAGCWLEGTKIPAKSKVIHRMPDEGILESLKASAERAGAAGVIYFALPGPGIKAAYSANHLAEKSAPELEVTITQDGAVVLKNQGGADLPANTSAGGWQLVLNTKAVGSFRSGPPGEFAQLTVPRDGLPEFSTSIIFHFSKLEIGRSLTSAPLLAEGHVPSWSIVGTAASGMAKISE